MSYVQKFVIKIFKIGLRTLQMFLGLECLLYGSNGMVLNLKTSQMFTKMLLLGSDWGIVRFWMITTEIYNF